MPCLPVPLLHTAVCYDYNALPLQRVECQAWQPLTANSDHILQASRVDCCVSVIGVPTILLLHPRVRQSKTHGGLEQPSTILLDFVLPEIDTTIESNRWYLTSPHVPPSSLSLSLVNLSR